MEQINKDILKNIFTSALNDLGVKGKCYDFVFERIGGRFKTKENACEVSSAIVYINEDWADYCISQYQYDLTFIMAHEARHVYQHFQIEEYYSGRTICEETPRIEKWIYEFKNYIRNEGPETFEAHSRQDVEIDANAYACLYCLLAHVGQPRFAPCVEEESTGRLIELAKRRGIELIEKD